MPFGTPIMALGVPPYCAGCFEASDNIWEWSLSQLLAGAGFLEEHDNVVKPFQESLRGSNISFNIPFLTYSCYKQILDLKLVQ